MAEQARSAVGTETLEVVADRGNYEGRQIKACEDVGISVTRPKPQISGSKAEGRLGKQDFAYDGNADVYLGPAGGRLANRVTGEARGKTIRRIWTTACRTCPLKAQCTTSAERRISSWEHEAVLEKVQARLDNTPDPMTLRRSTAEHPFGTIPCWTGATHFVCRTQPVVATEMALDVLAYTMQRVIARLLVRAVTDAMQA